MCSSHSTTSSKKCSSEFNRHPVCFLVLCFPYITHQRAVQAKEACLYLYLGTKLFNVPGTCLRLDAPLRHVCSWN